MGLCVMNYNLTKILSKILYVMAEIVFCLTLKL